MKKIVIILLICIAQISVAQTYDEDVIMKTCSCIYNSQNDSVDAVVNSCLVKALLHSLAEDGISENKVLKDYVNQTYPDNESAEAQTYFGEYLEMLYKNCSAIQLLVERKQSKYYQRSDSEDANHYYLEGTYYRNGEKLDSAIISFNKTLAYDSLYIPAIDNASIAYADLGELDKAIEYSEKSLRIFPEGYSALLSLGNSYLAKGDYPKAMSNYAKAIKYSQCTEGYFGLGLVSFLDNDYATSARLMKHAYMIYDAQNISLSHNCEEYLKSSYYYMKQEGKEELFLEIAGEFAPKIYQPENFDQLKNMELNGEIDCRLMEPQILICDNYILSTPIDESNINRTSAIEAVKKWMAKTPNYIFQVDKNVAKILDKKGNIMAVFIAAMTKFSIENPEQGNAPQAVALYAWNTTLDYAANKANNIKITGELKKKIKAKDNGTLKQQLGLD